LPCTCSACADRGVKRRLLVRVLAVAQLRQLAAVDREHLREALPLVRKGKPLADHGIVGGCGSECLCRHALAEGERGGPVVPGQFLDQHRVIGQVGDDGDEGVVLAGGADHRRAADVDVLDDLIPPGPAGHRLLERVEVGDEQVDRADLMRFHRGGMLRVVAHGEQAAMDQRVQRLHAAVHHLGEAGDVGHVAHLQAGIAQGAGGAAGGDQLHPALGETGGEFDHAALVGHRQQRAPDRHLGHIPAHRTPVPIFSTTQAKLSPPRETRPCTTSCTVP
jgi:hypothetical protein